MVDDSVPLVVRQTTSRIKKVNAMPQYRLDSRETKLDYGFSQHFPDRETMLDHAMTVISSLGRDKFTLDRDFLDVTITTSYRVWHYRKIES